MATIEEIAAGLRSGTPVQKPTTATQTFDPKYINSYGGLVSGATNPNLAANLNKYEQLPMRMVILFLIKIHLVAIIPIHLRLISQLKPYRALLGKLSILV
jgi:hypothetical protein